MSTERDELAKVIVAAYGEDAEVECPCEQDLDVADAILAAGYRKPRQVSTALERAALPPGAICKDGAGNAWKRGTGSWVGTGEGGPLFDNMDMELTVLYTPDAPTETGSPEGGQ